MFAARKSRVNTFWFRSRHWKTISHGNGRLYHHRLFWLIRQSASLEDIIEYNFGIIFHSSTDSFATIIGVFCFLKRKGKILRWDRVESFIVLNFLHRMIWCFKITFNFFLRYPGKEIVFLVRRKKFKEDYDLRKRLLRINIQQRKTFSFRLFAKVFHRFLSGFVAREISAECLPELICCFVYGHVPTNKFQSIFLRHYHISIVIIEVKKVSFSLVT